MSLFQQLEAAAARAGLRFLVIGGHAVIEHGFQRGTEDADIMVGKEERARWLAVIEGLGYKLVHDGGTFLQFAATDSSQWDLDLMLVPADVLARLLAAGQSAQMEGATVAVPGLEHLLALKVHALKHGRGLRVLKDLTDVAQLITANRVDAKAPWLRALFDKDANQELYEQVVQLLT